MLRLVKSVTASSVAAMAVHLVIGFYSAHSEANGQPQHHPGIEVRWTPSRLVASVKPGETVSIPVSLIAKERLDDLSVVFASNTLDGVVAVSPTSFDQLRKGQSATITVQLTLPILAQPGTSTGFIQLYEKSKRWKKPMPIQWALPIAVTTQCPCLPPDPGEAGKATIEGIDSDNDGVRDDVQRYIAIAVPESARHREALRQNSSLTGRILLAQSADESIQLARESIRTMECLDYLGFIRQGRWKEIKALMANTPARLGALERHTSRINGQVFSTLPDAQRSTACSFNPGALPN
jgi:hypothetical protein